MNRFAMNILELEIEKIRDEGIQTIPLIDQYEIDWIRIYFIDLKWLEYRSSSGTLMV